jgi:tetratricopeptide (TPR) repeat protein
MKHHSAILRFILLAFTASILISCNQGSNKGNDGQSDTIPVALRQFNEKIAGDANNPTYHYERAKWLAENSRFPGALTDIGIALDHDTLNPDYFVTLGDVYLGLAKFSNAENAYLKALKINPKHNDALLQLAKYHLVFKNYDQTLMLAEEALKEKPQNPKAYYLAAFSFMEKGDTLKALRNFIKATEFDQNYFDAYIRLALLYSKKQPKLAEGYFKRAIIIKPAYAPARYLLAMFYQDNKQIDKAILTYEQILTTNPHYKEAMFNLGYIFMAEKLDFDKAITYFNQAISEDARYAEAYMNRGYCNEMIRNTEEAKTDYKMVLTLKPNFDKAVEGLNRIDAKK